MTANPTCVPNTEGYQDWWHTIANHLGAVYPFIDRAHPGRYSLSFETRVSHRRLAGNDIRFDPVAVAAKTCFPFIPGDRTLLEGIRRAPWMSYPSDAGKWELASLPPHGQSKPSAEAFLATLKKALIDEAEQYVRNASSIGLLLSGGMDSRIVAGVLREIELRHGQDKRVVALTWGDELSRDVTYARRIAERFKWDLIHFPLNAQLLSQNIAQAAHAGAETSPFHLHALPQVAECKGLDVVLAGSYGDSVGRAEFSGRRLTSLRPLLPKVFDRFGLLKRSVKSEVFPKLITELCSAPHMSPDLPRIRRCEIEQEMHYMRRMLQASMMLVSFKIPLFQMFTAPSVFGLMWRLDPALRDDRWYRQLLLDLPGDLLSIPWARTGRRFDSVSGEGDSLSRMNHAYGIWLRKNLRGAILDRVNSQRIRALGFFNPRGVAWLLKTWEKATTNSINRVDEAVSWLAVLHDFIEIYQPEQPQIDTRHSQRDDLAALIGGCYGNAFINFRNRRRS